MMAAETDDAFERAADTEYRWQTRRRGDRGSLARARYAFHGKINGLLFLLVALGVHWYFVQRVTNWVIAHVILIVLTFIGLVSAWGDQRVAEARLLERRAASDD